MYHDDWQHRGDRMDSDTVKKAGVVAIIVLLALYVAGYLVIIALTDIPLAGVIAYGVIAFGILVLLTYEGWLRFKEIDEGLEDAVNDY